MSLENEDQALSSTEELKKETTESLQNSKRKPFLGGYRHKFTGKVYHHASVQTQPSPWKYDSVLRFNRDAQTLILEDKAQQTPRDASTQVAARKFYLSTKGDKVLNITSSYVYGDDIKKAYLNKIILLQKYIRRWLAQQELLKRKKNALLQILWDKEQFHYKSQHNIDWQKDLAERRQNPKSNDDFKLLFSDLQKWWEFNAKCISEAKSGADLKAAMWLLVNAETKKIEEINREKNISEQTIYSEAKERFLRKAAKPKMWMAYGDRIQVQTGDTQKASYFHDLYTTLSMKYLSAQDRMDALTNLKEMLKPYSCKLTDDLIQLANREIDLHLRGVKSSYLEGLQTRIRDLFWQLAKKPRFNPEMERLHKIKKCGSSPYILCCAACKCFYILATDSTDEALGKSVLENYFRKCKKCLDIENEAWIRKDLELYKRILKLLILEEEKKSSISSIIYMLQPNDIGHLVENIWKHQSCISSSRNDTVLEFIRYNKDDNWTPWNCLLVTRQEAANLSSIPNSETKYDGKFQQCVSQKHAEARKYFSTIPRFLPYLTRLTNENHY